MKDIVEAESIGLGDGAVCIAKTQYSLSDDPTLIGRPKGFTLHVRAVEIASGAGFVIPLTGEMMRMPGLSKHPAAEGITMDDDGIVDGLF